MKTPVDGHKLAKFGFVHVTDLTARDRASGREYLIRGTIEALGTWGKNNGYTVVITQTGKVWLSFGYNHEDLQSNPGEWDTTLREICPNGGDRGGPTAFCAIIGGHEQIDTSAILMRIMNPSWNPLS